MPTTKVQLIWKYGKLVLLKLMRTKSFLVLQKIKCLLVEMSKIALFIEQQQLICISILLLCSKKGEDNIILHIGRNDTPRFSAKQMLEKLLSRKLLSSR